MIKSLPRLFVFIFILNAGCNTAKKPEPINTGVAIDSTGDKKFFPVTEFFYGQLKEIENLPVTPLMITSVNGKDDSTWLKREVVRKFAQPFLQPVIDTANLSDTYVQSSFLDQTINAVTFTYALKKDQPDTISLKEWNVYIDPKKGSILRVYMIKEKQDSGRSITNHLTWKTGQWCKITTITEAKGKQPDIKDEKIIWDLDQ